MTAVSEGFRVSRIGQIAMTVGDLPRAVAFYRDVLGMRFLFEAPPAMAFFDCGGIRLMLSLPEQGGADPGRQFGSILYYAVDDIHAAAAALEAELATLAPAERETIAAATALLERLRHGSGSTAGHDEAGATGRTGKTGGGRRKAR